MALLIFSAQNWVWGVWQNATVAAFTNHECKLWSIKPLALLEIYTFI